MHNPGLAPWAMQEYRPYRALLRLPIYFYFDALALDQPGTCALKLLGLLFVIALEFLILYRNENFRCNCCRNLEIVF